MGSRRVSKLFVIEGLRVFLDRPVLDAQSWCSLIIAFRCGPVGHKCGQALHDMHLPKVQYRKLRLEATLSTACNQTRLRCGGCVLLLLPLLGSKRGWFCSGLTWG